MDNNMWVCRCGTTNNDRFCVKCGSPRPVQQPMQQTPPPMQPTQQTPPPAVQQPQQYAPQMPQRNMNQGYDAQRYLQQGSNNSNTTKLLLIGIIVAGLCGGAFYFGSNFKSAPAASQPAQTEQAKDATVVNSNPPAVQYKKAHITGTEVRMRDGAGTNNAILGYFDKGESVDVLEIQTGWMKVRRSNGSEGWVSDKFCVLD